MARRLPDAAHPPDRAVPDRRRHGHLSRLVANKLTETAGWQIVVDNRPGAAGNIGLDGPAAKAPADGYTMVTGQTSNLSVNPSLLREAAVRHHP